MRFNDAPLYLPPRGFEGWRAYGSPERQTVTLQHDPCGETFEINPLKGLDIPECACVRARRDELAWRAHFGVLVEVWS